MKKLSRYSKAIVAGGLVLVAVGHALVDDSISSQEWTEIGLTAATAFGVYKVKNTLPG